MINDFPRCLTPDMQTDSAPGYFGVLPSAPGTDADGRGNR